MSTAERRWPDLAGRFEERTHILPVRVYYEDTDFSGIVYHANYLKFIERGRSDFLRLKGLHHHEMEAGKHGPPLVFAVRKMEIEFLKSARIDDALVIHTRLNAVRGARINMQQSVWRGEEKLFEAEVMIAVITPEGWPVRLPAALAEALNA
ncbi:tol-pal system-associated acyl-CoA thioesterase [Polycladidibacter hongkongensis]|uniref:tol-pal system-associated acyl-CoA thioesterase n=1 Tax=Polycladidibacter hongkongensis TaxID=1647556 RepID=UPI00082D6546|nr:tol-pal system-associated acyl-CoA thioesterase [Pseudovibrio hongkongensis]